MRLQSAVFVIEETLPGREDAGKVLSILKMEGVWMYGVTALERAEAERALADAGLADCFRGLLTAREALCTLADAKLYEKAMRRLRSEPRDTIVFGDVTPEKMGGTKDSVAALTAVEYALARQSDWILGQFQYTKLAGYNFNSDTIYAMIETVCTTLEDCIWEYNTSVYPFVLHIRQMTSEVASEMRMDRNITTMRKSVDRSRMYTRHYPIGKNNLHITGDYTSRNENIYGVISKVETDQSKDSVANLLEWSTARLRRHCEPSVTVTINGLELSEATGEPLDHFVIGKKCRVPLPEFNTTITERVTKLAWRNKLAEPENVTITLANELMDVATILKEEKAAGGGGGKAGAKKGEEDHAWFVDTTTHVAMVAEAVAGEGAAEDWSRVAQVVVDGNGVHQRVTTAEGKLVTQQTQLDLTADKVSMVVGTGASGNYIKAGEITLAINSSTGQSTATINADHILIGNQNAETVINGKITADDITTTFLSGKIADIPLVTCKAIVCQGAVAASGSVSGDIVAAGTTFALNGNSCTDLIKSASVSGNTLTLTYLSGATVNFSKAASAVTVDSITAPAAAASTVVTSTTVTATASNGATKTATMAIAKASPSASGGYATVNLGGTPVLRVSLDDWWNGGKNSVTVSTISAPAGGTSQTATLTATASNGATKTRNIFVTNGGFADGGIYAQAKLDDSNGSIIARQWISLPASATWWHEWNGNNISVSCTVGGKSYSISFAHGM